MPLLFMQALASRAWEQDQSLSLCILLGYQCLLRTGEIMGLRLQDFDYGTGDLNAALVSLGLTKSGRRRGEREAVVCDDPALVRMMHAYSQGKDPSRPLWEYGGPAFRSRFRDLCESFALGRRIVFQGYSLRRGGATHLYLLTRNLSLVTTRGRWQNQSTARIYIHEAANEKTQLNLTEAERKELEDARSRFIGSANG
jgi:integrase